MGLVAAGTIVFEVWSWRGRSYRARWWTRDIQGEFGVLVMLPMAGPFFLGLSLAAVSDALFVPGAVLFMAGCGLFVWSFLITTIALVWRPIHKLWGPRWYVRMSKQEQLNALTGELPAAARRMDAGTAGVPPDWLGAARSTWGAGLIVDMETRERPDAVSRRGTVAGTLVVGEGGLWFAPNAAPGPEWTDRAQFVARWQEIREARRVPARADAAGVRRHGFLYRSWFPRLVVITDTGNRLFEVNFGRARRVADTIDRERSRVVC